MPNDTIDLSAMRDGLDELFDGIDECHGLVGEIACVLSSVLRIVELERYPVPA